MRTGRRRDPVDQVAAALAACAAFVDLDPAEVRALAGRAAVEEAGPGDTLPAEVAARPLLCQEGTLLVCEPGGRPIDLLGEGGFRAPNRVEALRPLDRVRVAALPGEALDVAWAALRGFELLGRLRLEAEVAGADGAAHNRLTPEDLHPAVRAQLRRLFRDIDAAQEGLRTEYHLTVS